MHTTGIDTHHTKTILDQNRYPRLNAQTSESIVQTDADHGALNFLDADFHQY